MQMGMAQNLGLLLSELVTYQSNVQLYMHDRQLRSIDSRKVLLFLLLYFLISP